MKAVCFNLVCLHKSQHQNFPLIWVCEGRVLGWKRCGNSESFGILFYCLFLSDWSLFAVPIQYIFRTFFLLMCLVMKNGIIEWAVHSSYPFLQLSVLYPNAKTASLRNVVSCRIYNVGTYTMNTVHKECFGSYSTPLQTNFITTFIIRWGKVIPLTGRGGL
jgi:hypothetical protein